jgi:hypothetical protein
MRVTVGLKLGAMEGPAPTCYLTGKIIGADDRTLWVRLLPLFSGEIAEADVSADGQFEIGVTQCADYILAIMGGSKAVTSVPLHVTTADANPVSIRLQPN